MDQKQVTQLSIHHIQPNPLQPRGILSTESLQELADSIKEHGILEPLVVAHTPAGYQIVAGERRWRAAKLAGLEMVPVLIKETSPKGMLELALVENVQRIDLNPIERAKAFQRLMEEFGLNTTDVAARIAKSPAYVSNTIRLLTLPDAVKDGLISGLIFEGHARALAGISDVKTMIEAYKILLKEEGTVRRAEELARRFRERIGDKRTGGRPERRYIISDQIDEVQERMQKILAVVNQRSKIKLTRSRAETKLVIILKGSPEETEEMLQKIVKGVTGE
jgi:ParB family chromosome partitioning protein